MATLKERIASLALLTFDNLPKKSKPRIHPDGSREWVPMSAIVLVRGKECLTIPDADSASEQLTCVSLATGCKCLPASSLPKCRGQVLHDSHAEILALRGINYFLLSEISLLLLEGTTYESDFICAHSSSAGADEASAESVQWPPYCIRSNISIHMFSTEAPCGDASMEILMSELGLEASLPWIAPTRSLTPQTRQPERAKPESLRGRGFFSDLGIVRRKPSRADAEPTLSKSCTDKLSVKQITSVICFPTYHFIAPTPNVYLSSLILPHSKYSETGCSRAFGPSGRLAPLQKLLLPDPYIYRPFSVLPLPKDFQLIFPFTKSAGNLNPDQMPHSNSVPTPPSPPSTNDLRTNPALDLSPKLKPKPKPRPHPSNLSALSIHRSPTNPTNPLDPKTPPLTSTLLNGIHQGHALTSPSPRKASLISRSSLLQLGRQIAESILLLINNKDQSHHILKEEELTPFLAATTYAEAKACRAGMGLGENRQRAKDVVTGLLAGERSADSGGGEGGSSSRGWVRNTGDEDWEII